MQQARLSILAAPFLGVSYRQSGSDTKLGGTPVHIDRVTSYSSPRNTGNMTLDKQRQNQYLFRALRYERFGYYNRMGRLHPSRNMRTQQ